MNTIKLDKSHRARRKIMQSIDFIKLLKSQGDNFYFKDKFTMFTRYNHTSFMDSAFAYPLSFSILQAISVSLKFI